jgi:two-component system NtrC family sensor kinase
MPPFPRRLAQITGLIRDPANPAGSATRPLRVLLVGSIVLPVSLFAVASVISYRQHFVDARDRLERNLAIVHEHAQKVFETFEFASRYIDEITQDEPDAAIRASEAALSDRLRTLTKSMPQLRDLWIIGGDGHPLVSGTDYPMPRIDLSDRNYFSVHRDGRVAGAYVSQVLDARAANTRFFAISRKRTVHRKFSGVTIVSIAPEYFTDFYSKLPPPSAAALLREDGAVLARYPDSPDAPRRLPANAMFVTAVQARPQAGLVRAVSSVDGRERIFAYHRMSNVPL